MDNQPKSAYDMALIAHSDGQAALARGYTQTARERHRSAALHLQEETQHYCGTKLNELLAKIATQRWLAGDYEVAFHSAKLVKPEQLRNPESWIQFVKDIEERTSPNYHYSICKQCNSFMESGNWQAVIDLLTEHPFIYSQLETSLIRAYCLLKLGQPEAALCFLRIAMESAGFTLP